MLSFLNSAMLPALAASLIPLLIHLLYRRRPTELPFSNLALLVRLQQGRLGLFRQPSWLLLLLRTLAILFLALAFARPIIGDAASFATSSGSPDGRAIVILLDRSFSMRCMMDGRRLFDSMVEKASAMISALSVRDRVYLLGFSDRVAPLSPGWLCPPGEAVDILARSEPTFESTDIAPALREAAMLLRDCPEAGRNLIVLSDLESHGFANVQDSVAFFARGVSVSLFREGRGKVRNASVDSVWLGDQVVVEGMPVTVFARISNHGDVVLDPLVVDALAAGRKVSGRTERLAPGETRDFSFEAGAALPGQFAGYVGIGGDDLVADNRRFFSMAARDTLRVVLLGDQAPDLHYVEDALRAGFSPGVLRIDAHLLSAGSPPFPAGLAPGPGQGIDLVVLSNVRSLSSNQVEFVEECLRTGGGVLVALGDLVDAAAYNDTMFPGIMPARLIPLPGATPGNEGFLQFDRFDFSHPVLDGLRPHIDSLRRPRFRTAYGVEQPGRDVRTPIAFGNGLPALCDAPRGNGRVLLLNAGLSPRGGDFPVSGVFAPLVQRAAGYLASGLPVSFGICPSARLPRAGDEGAGETAVLESPTGDLSTVSSLVNEGQASWNLGPLHSPGIWRMRRGDREIGQFAVNLDAEESRRGAVGEARLSRIFRGNELHFVDADRTPAGGLKAAASPAPRARELWAMCLVAALVALCLEALVGRGPDRVPVGNRR